jgi:hypothetical protein
MAMTRLPSMWIGFRGAALLVAALAIVAGPACDDGGGIGPSRTGEVVVLAAGERYPAGGGPFTIGFVGVDEDSRCPSSVDCVQAGNGRVSLDLQSSPAQIPVIVRLHTNAGAGPRSVTWDGYKILLVSLDPYPESDAPIPPGDYSVALRIDPAP